MLQMSAIDSYYGRSHVLQGVALEAPAGRITAVLGRNGTGKTTLMKTIMGLTDRMSGSIRLDGTEIGHEPTFRRARAGIGYVPQGREIIPDFTIHENILMGAFARTDGRIEVPALVPELFPYLPENYDRRGGVLSGGQQQQLAIARALVTRPKLLVLDEPTEGIQPSIIKDIGRAITYLRSRGEMAIVLVEQYFAWARDLCDSYAVMDRGQVVLAGPRAGMVEADVLRWMSV